MKKSSYARDIIAAANLRERGSHGCIDKSLDGRRPARLSLGRNLVFPERTLRRAWLGVVSLATVFIAASLAAFAPEHFKGPEFVQAMVPSWMPGHLFWAYFVGCALIAAATSLAMRRFERLSSMLLGLMFFLFVGMLYLPSAIRHPGNRFGWTYALRDLSFCAGAWALAAAHSRASSPRLANGLTLFARHVLAVAAVFYGIQHFLHPDFVLGVPLENKLPARE